MAIRRKRKTPVNRDEIALRVAVTKQPAIDLGALQAEHTAAGKALKASSTRLQAAQESHDAARARHATTVARLQAAARTVLSES